MCWKVALVCPQSLLVACPHGFYGEQSSKKQSALELASCKTLGNHENSIRALCGAVVVQFRRTRARGSRVHSKEAARTMSEAVSKSQKPLRSDEATTKSLISACYAGDLERVVALLGDGADPSATDVVGWFPLYQAACGGDSHSEDHAKVIATLIDHGVHPDQRTPNGETALMAAAYRGHAPCVAILVMKGADAHTTASSGPWEGRDCFWIA